MIVTNSYKKRYKWILSAILIGLICTIILAISLGYSSVSIDRLIPTILGQGSFKDEFVLFSIRLPRMIITLLAGVGLALSGAILQGVTKNDLADPGIIGINAGAGVAITLFYLFYPLDTGIFVFLLPIIAFFGAMITALLIYAFSYERKRGIQPSKLILTGIGFSMALSGLMIVLISSSESQKVDFIARWLAGNIWGYDWSLILSILPWFLILIPFILYKAHQLNVLGLSEQVTIGVGVPLQKERTYLLMAAVAIAAVSVSVTGGVAFVGLMAPHIARALVGPRHQYFLPVAMLLGGWLLLVADTIGRNVLEPDGIPAGIVVSLIGAPYFIYLLLKNSRM
ncbi:iron ABC transporter permease [Alkalihalobacillus alcalophilus ATCC 27647 = CGMCC 1.3604]|uniref:Cobalamin/Fe3+-siderophores transporter n=1 Tax=Alkalihalobacillus alcalophilus ATCC 27647 = CGMCC 1.3604 TaxID=1218173 RepID=J8TL56_ALKAL|nr:iron ABC transporter permease [Alkalihalobacillus alcalophilus]AFV25741.1 cobalamin/Fe3+-siderophores transporter [Alkalihalobacillus alcalophilus ATCC 27647 = CGMCC 1.3604]KGA96343.1 iron ABC transporter permease [Alkalihalobacillus alcalophilus ATCC 27647 = CGMCC 1.3604]MED1563838.1 iron ABC transporter permease [Alkalihalobacillus alcalophilus]THG90165.1 iron ABC transporter permease [Alkalihalobacillus alcalophilus ATCC 27647 = CGMCC 1.3604]